MKWVPLAALTCGNTSLTVSCRSPVAHCGAMNTRGTLASLAVAMLGLATACGSSDDSAVDPAAETSSTPPSTVTLTVTLTDAPPLDVLQNGSRGKCTSVDLAAALMGGGDQTPVEVTVRDADDTIVGTTQLPKRGGTFDRDAGCVEWPVTFDDLEPSDFYQVTLSSRAGDQDTTVQRADAAEVSTAFDL